MFTDVMLDLETWGLTPYSALRSIGARMFNIGQQCSVFDLYSTPPTTAVMHKELIVSSFSDEKSFYCNIDLDSCRAETLTVDPATEQWWGEQNPDVIKALESEQKPLAFALGSFVEWIKLNSNSDIRIWSNGASFDVVLIEAAMSRVNILQPWRYYNVRDTRTLKHMAWSLDTIDAAWPVQFKRGVHHALFDADFQAFEAQQHWNIVNRGWLGRLLSSFRF